LLLTFNERIFPEAAFKAVKIKNGCGFVLCGFAGRTMFAVKARNIWMKGFRGG
jgi:hypothetical protein